MKICKQCKGKINSSNIYHDFVYCSKSCATTAQRGGLTKEFDNVVCEVTSEDLLSPKGYPLRIDFYIPELNLFIEADGTQHTDPNNPWYSEYYAECDH